MNLFLGLCAFFLTLTVIPGTLELLLVTLGAIFPTKKNGTSHQKKQKIIVIIPAHNEELHLQKTLDSLKQNQEPAEIVVIADNCEDKTAEIARKNHVRVIERTDKDHIGKHFALNYAFTILLKENFDLFLIVDADCVCAPNLIQEIQSSICKGVDGVQVRYELNNLQIDFKKRFLRIAYNAVTYLRPLGRQAWGLSTGILGSGFAVRREVVEQIKIPTNSVVEDACWHLQMVKASYVIGFNPFTSVTSEIPETIQNVSKQRERWEGGRLRMLVEELPDALKELFKGNWKMMEPCFDLMLLPLSYHAILLILLFLFPFGWAKVIALAGLFILIGHVLTSMIITRASWKDWAALFLAPFYLVAKLLFVFKLFKSKPLWEKTSRGTEPVKSVPKNHKETL